jgi:MFS family permease
MIAAMSTRELLACRDYMRLWWARLAGVGASQMLLVAIGWQMYDLTGSAWDLGLVGLLQFLPALALVLVAGHVVDRHHRARIVALCVALQGLVALALAAAPFDGLSQRTLLLALALSVVLGAVRAFQMPAQQALVPLLVPPALLRARWPFRRPGCRAPSSPGRRWAASSTSPVRRWSTGCARRCSGWRRCCACASATPTRRRASR